MSGSALRGLTVVKTKIERSAPLHNSLTFRARYSFGPLF